MNNWFIKKEFPLCSKVRTYVDNWSADLDPNKWVYEPWQAPGTRSVRIDISDQMHQEIQNIAQLPLYNEWYIWDFMNAKDLLIHKDTNRSGDYRSMAFIIAIDGKFENQIFEDDQTTLIDSVIYGPGDCLILNNSKYYHGGKVLSKTRKTISCWIDVKETDSTLEQIIAQYKL